MESNEHNLPDRIPLKSVENQEILRETMENKENVMYEDEDEEEEEVFFGDVSDKEKRKAEKFSKRRTIVFNPGFRSDRKLMRYTMDPARLAALSEEGSVAASSDDWEDIDVDKETVKKEENCDVNGSTKSEMINGNSEGGSSDDNNGNNSNNIDLDASGDLFDSINESSGMDKSSQETNEKDSEVNELIEMVPKLDLSSTENVIDNVERTDEQRDPLTVYKKPANNSTEITTVLQSSNDPTEVTSECISLSQVSEQDTGLPIDIKTTSETGSENNETTDVTSASELDKNMDKTEETKTVASPSNKCETRTVVQIGEGNEAPSKMSDKQGSCANEAANMNQENVKETNEQSGENVTKTNKQSEENTTDVNEQAEASLENKAARKISTVKRKSDINKEKDRTPVNGSGDVITIQSNQLDKEIADETTSNSDEKNRPPGAPNSARIGFKRSSTSAFQVTPRKADLWSSLPNLNFGSTNGSSAEAEPVSPSVVFTETNFSPTLKVNDIKRPNTLFVDPLMMIGNSQLSFDFHEKECNAQELESENLLKPFVPGENEEQYSDSGLPSTPSTPFDFPRFQRSSWSDSVLRTAPELISEEPFPKLDFNIDIDSPGRTPASDMEDILAKKKAQLDQLRLEKLKIQQRLVFKQTHNSSPDLSGLGPRSAKSHCPMPTASSLPRVRYKDTQSLSLASKELEAVTQLHTLTNSHRSVKVIKKPRSANTKHVTVIAREASRLQWLETIATPATLKHRPNRKAVSATKPILHQRPMDYTYPYHEEQPAIVVVSKSRRSSTGGIHTKPLPLVDELETGLKKSNEK